RMRYGVQSLSSRFDTALSIDAEWPMRSVMIVVLAAAVWPGSGIVRGEDAAAAAQAPARLVYPNGLAITNDGELLIYDIGSHSILKCDSHRSLTVLAGTGKPGFS